MKNTSQTIFDESPFSYRPEPSGFTQPKINKSNTEFELTKFLIQGASTVKMAIGLALSNPAISPKFNNFYISNNAFVINNNKKYSHAERNKILRDSMARLQNNWVEFGVYEINQYRRSNNE